MKTIKYKISASIRALMFLSIISFFVLFPTHQSKATCATCAAYQMALQQEFTTHMNWMNNQWWTQYVEPALKSLANEYRNAVYLEVLTFGAFLDGQNLMSAQRAMQELNTTSLKNYTTSDAVCRFGTLSRSLALSQAKGEVNQLLLSKRSLNRQLGQKNLASSEGETLDRKARLIQFQKNYCDPDDFGTGMKSLCIGTSADTKRNIDINFTRAVDTRNTLDIDFSDVTDTEDEKAIMALANNLYAHNIFSRINVDALKNTNNTDLRSTYLDQRSIVAKRNVAENTFNEIIGQKSNGSVASKTYFTQVLNNLGLSNTDVDKYLGAAPSYDAQMEVLTKKLYQDPAFYANLMDSPANISRQYAALQSFGLMQKRDIFETVARSEILMSLLLEMEVARYQDALQNRQN